MVSENLEDEPMRVPNTSMRSVGILFWVKELLFVCFLLKCNFSKSFFSIKLLEPNNLSQNL